MRSVAARNLMVRIGEIGYLIDLVWVVEIREQIGDQLDVRHRVASQGIAGALSFRQTRIPAIDPASRLALASQVAMKDKTALVLKSSEGNWALLVDRVEGICPADRLVLCQIPPLLKVAAGGYYSEIAILQQEPMVVLDPEQFYGSPAGVA
jgi:chemotaxis signal transduction protein